MGGQTAVAAGGNTRILRQQDLTGGILNLRVTGQSLSVLTGKGEGVFCADLQTGNLHRITLKCDLLLSNAGGTVGYDPFSAYQVICFESNQNGSVFIADSGGQFMDSGLRIGGKTLGDMAHKFMKALGLQVDRIAGLGIKIRKDRNTCGKILPHGVSVTVETNNGQRGMVHGGIDLNGKHIAVQFQSHGIDLL